MLLMVFISPVDNGEVSSSSLLNKHFIMLMSIFKTEHVPITNWKSYIFCSFGSIILTQMIWWEAFSQERGPDSSKSSVLLELSVWPNTAKCSWKLSCATLYQKLAWMGQENLSQQSRRWSSVPTLVCSFQDNVTSKIPFRFLWSQFSS